MHHWIAEPAALTALCTRIAATPRIGLDTEFMRVRTYWPELALVQVADAHGVSLIDPVALADLSPLAPILTRTRPVLIMHSASEDLVALAPIAQGALKNLFDTQVAAAFAGLGAGIGYQRLIADLLGVQLAKAETRSNWLARPLSAQQLAYADADVAHLLDAHDALLERLDRRGKLAWCEEECARLAAAASNPAASNPHWEFRNAWRWPLPRQALLKRLLEWREATAQQINRPRLWLFDNSAAANLVEAPPATAAELSTRLATQKAFPKREFGNLFDALQAPLSDEDLAIVPVPEPLKGDAERRFETLRDRIAKRAEELDLPPALIGSRRVIEAIVRLGENAPELSGWRTEAIGDLVKA